MKKIDATPGFVLLGVGFSSLVGDVKCWCGTVGSSGALSGQAQMPRCFTGSSAANAPRLLWGIRWRMVGGLRVFFHVPRIVALFANPDACCACVLSHSLEIARGCINVVIVYLVNHHWPPHPTPAPQTWKRPFFQEDVAL